MASDKSIYIQADGFTHKGIKYLYSEVAHIFCSHKVTTQKVNIFLTVGEARSFGVRITLHNGKKIEILIDEMGIIVGFNKDLSKEIEALKGAVGEIYRTTFTQRLAPYEAEVAGKGYFTYDECLFYPGKKIVFRTKEFFLEDLALGNYGFAVELKKRNASLMDKIIRANSPFKTPQFNTQTDFDVISCLLLKYFRVQLN
jgi:hypothetical protein